MVLIKFAFILFITFIITPLDANDRRKQKNPCGHGRTALAGYFCGRGSTRQNCPPAYECIIAPNDAYAVCCRRSKQIETKPTKSIEKSGSCPESSGTISSCIPQCDNDGDCPKHHKCCGRCPRDCVQPLQ